MNQKKCPVCEKVFETVFAMQQHFADVHRSGMVPVMPGVPDSTVDGSLPELRCENCRYWGKANNLTVCRFKPGVPAMIQTTAGPQLVSLFPPANANEWCGSYRFPVPSCFPVPSAPTVGIRDSGSPMRDYPNSK